MTAERFPLGASVTLAELERDPHPVLARLREREPVSWVPALDGWLVTRRDLVVEALRDSRRLTVDDPRFSTARIIGPSMLSTDGAQHTRHRAPFVPPYRKSVIEDEFRDWLHLEAARLIDGFDSDGSAELRAAYAAPLAVRTIIRSLGLVAVSDETVLGWYRTIVRAVEEITAGHTDQPEAGRAFSDLRATVTATVEQAIDSLIASAAQKLSVHEVASNAAVLMFGAIETVEGAIANALWHLLTHPAERDLVTSDPSRIANAVEESIRLEPAAASLDRYATEDVELGGATIAAGDYVILSLAGANRDPAVFEDPDRFDARRSNAAQHVGFAVGPHACLGIHLARRETSAAVEELLVRLPGLRIDVSRSAPPTGLVFRKPAALTVRW